MIAHRLSTVVDADEIVVLDHPAPVEHGTHAALLAKVDMSTHPHLAAEVVRAVRRVTRKRWSLGFGQRSIDWPRARPSRTSERSKKW